MPKHIQRQSFRHRGFRDAEKDEVVMMFGDGDEPTDSTGAPLKKLWDHDIEQVMTAKDHDEE